MIECRAPFQVPPDKRNSKFAKTPPKTELKLAFSRDGTKLVQLSTYPEQLQPSPIHVLPIPGGERFSAWPPVDNPADPLAVAVRRSATDMPGLIAYYNQRMEDEASRLPLESGLQISPDGRRTARFDADDFKIHIVDRHSNKEIVAFPSGLDPERFLAKRKVDVAAFDPFYKFAGAPAHWSPDGKRLFVRVGITSSYRWGYSSVYRDTATGPSLRVPDIHFDCVIVLSAD